MGTAAHEGLAAHFEVKPDESTGAFALPADMKAGDTVKVELKGPFVLEGATPEWTPPESWKPNPMHEVCATAIGVDVLEEAHKFRAYEHARPVKDWDQAFHRWLHNVARARQQRQESAGEQQQFAFVRPRKLRHIAADLVNHGRRLGHTEACRALRTEHLQTLVRILEASTSGFRAPDEKDEPEAFRRGFVELRDALSSWHAALETTPLPKPPAADVAERLAAELAENVGKPAPATSGVPLRLIVAGGLMRLALAISPSRPSPAVLKARAQAEELVAKLEQLLGIKPSEPAK